MAGRGMIHIDASELERLAVDLSGAPLRVRLNAGEGLRKGARVIDRAMTEDASGHMGNYFGRPGTSYETPLEAHVSHEMIGPLTAEIGIEYKGAGKLAHIIVFGSANNAPVYDHMSGPRRVLPQVERFMADEAEESVFGDGKR